MSHDAAVLTVCSCYSDMSQLVPDDGSTCVGGHPISTNDDACAMSTTCTLYTTDTTGSRSVRLCAFACSTDECSHMLFPTGDGVGVHILSRNTCASYHVRTGRLGAAAAPRVSGGPRVVFLTPTPPAPCVQLMYSAIDMLCTGSSFSTIAAHLRSLCISKKPQACVYSRGPRGLGAMACLLRLLTLLMLPTPQNT